MAVNQDNIEVFADVFVAGTSGGNTVSVDNTTVTDAQKETGDGMVRTYQYGSSGSAALDVTWPGGTTDRPTTLSVTSQGADSYSVIFNNFKSGFAYGSAGSPMVLRLDGRRHGRHQRDGRGDRDRAAGRAVSDPPLGADRAG